MFAFARHVVAPLVDRDEACATDFTVFYTGWSLVLADPGHTYDVEAQRRVQAGIMQSRHFEGGVMTFYYPPHAAVAFAPLAVLGFENAFRLWMALQLAAAVLLVRWLLELSGLTRRLDRWILATAVLAFLPLLYALQIGQLSIAMTLALLGFWRAFERGRDAQAGLWLLALTCKPQLLPVPFLLMLATRRWRPAAWLCAFGAPVAGVAALVLGPRAWLDYPARARELEGFVAGGSHDHMLNLRGWFTRLAGPGHDGAILIASAIGLAVAAAVAYGLLRRYARRGRVPAIAFAAALALQLPANLHLHLQDALVWVLPLVMFAAYLREAGEPGRFEGFARFALSWPIVFVLTHALEIATGRLLPVPPQLVLAIALLVWIVREVQREGGAGRPMRSSTT